MIMEERLAIQAGIKPSPEWLDACRKHLHQQTQPSDNEDEVLHQILHTDLRNVVRRFDHSNNTSSCSEEQQKPSFILRKIIEKSCNVGNEQSSVSKATLPESFRCMIQIEELLDVSKNAEDRLSIGPASRSAPTPIGNQRKRCLKMVFSDGYFENGSPFRDTLSTSTSSGILVAVETQPIPQLSVHSQPGIKAILSGAIDVRFGVLMLDPGNTTVIGGCVPSLIPVQRKAMDMAARLAGVGIDPTFRALVWNPETGNEEESDEAEQGSSDVVVPRQVTPSPPLTNITNLPIPQNLENNYSSTFNEAANSTNVNPFVPPRQPINEGHTSVPPSRQSRQDVGLRLDSQNKTSSTPEPQHIQTQVKSIQNNTPSSTSIQPPSNPYTSAKAKISSYRQSRLSYQNGTESSDRLESHSKQIPNPYAIQSTPFSKHKHSVAKRDEVAPNGTRNAQENNVTNTPLAKLKKTYSTAIPVPIDLTSPNSTSASVSSLSTTSICRDASRKAPSSPYKMKSSSRKSVLLKATFTPEKKDLKPRSLESLNVMSPTALSEPVSFNELRSILQKAFSDSLVYDQYKTRTFIVPSKMSCSKRQKDKTHGFTLEKNRNHKKNKFNSEKHHYRMACQFTGPNETDGDITFQISHEILKPYFPISASEMRNIAKTDRGRGNAMANDSGQQFLNDFSSLATLYLKIVVPKEKIFDEKDHPFSKSGNNFPLDDLTPILLLCKREE